MGTLESAFITTRAEAKERKKERRHESAKIQQEKEEEKLKKKDQAAAGRVALIATTPQGVLSSQNSGRKRLTA